ncbi:MAG: hypothetical protein MOB07_27225 [Acidobacteria bacterium]|nr:hypothetical protein [Acidobacteriota bacterium]
MYGQPLAYARGTVPGAVSGGAQLIIVSGVKNLLPANVICHTLWPVKTKPASLIKNQINLYIFESIVVRHCASTAIIIGAHLRTFPLATS